MSARIAVRLEEGAIGAHVRRTLEKYFIRTERLQALTSFLDGHLSIAGDADADELRRAAVGIHTLASQTVLDALALVRIAERLATFGTVLEANQPERTEPAPRRRRKGGR